MVVNDAAHRSERHSGAGDGPDFPVIGRRRVGMGVPFPL